MQMLALGREKAQTEANLYAETATRSSLNRQMTTT